MTDVSADITISFQSTPEHSWYAQNNTCKGSSAFSDGVLAHAVYPTDEQRPVEIHINGMLTWNYNRGSNGYQMNEENFIRTLTHEIGHTLGLRHVLNDRHSIMYPSLQHDYTSSNPEFSADDIQAINAIYKKDSKTPIHVTAKHTPTPPSTLPSPTPKKNAKLPDLCQLSNVNQFLIFNRHMYIIHEEWFWPVDLFNKTYQKPKLIRDWFRAANVFHYHRGI